MPATALISLGITVVLLIPSLLLRLAGKLRLTIPLIYFLLTATFLNRWAAAHESLAFAILYGLIALSIVSWLFSFKTFLADKRYYKSMEEDITWQINRAKQQNIPLSSVYIDSSGNMRYKDTKEVVE